MKKLVACSLFLLYLPLSCANEYIMVICYDFYFQCKDHCLQSFLKTGLDNNYKQDHQLPHGNTVKTQNLPWYLNLNISEPILSDSIIYMLLTEEQFTKLQGLLDTYILKVDEALKLSEQAISNTRDMMSGRVPVNIVSPIDLITRARGLEEEISIIQFQILSITELSGNPPHASDRPRAESNLIISKKIMDNGEVMNQAHRSMQDFLNQTNNTRLILTTVLAYAQSVENVYKAYREFHTSTCSFLPRKDEASGSS